MQRSLWLAGFMLAASVLTAHPVDAGGRYGMVALGRTHGRVEIKLLKPGSQWRPARPGEELPPNGTTAMLRTGRGSWAHILVGRRAHRCVDSGSLVRINWDSEASIDVLRGKMSAVDGRRGKSLRDYWGP
jgi:hypothetical protein